MTFGESEHEKQKDMSEADMNLVRMQRQLTVVVLGMVAAYLLLQVSAYFSDILRILGFSVLFSYLFIVVVDGLEKVTHHRALSIFIVYLVLAVIVGIGFVLILPAAIYQVTQLVTATFNGLPQLVQWLVAALRPLETRLHAAQIQVKAIDIVTNIAGSIPKPDPTMLVGRVTDVAMSTMTYLLYGLSIVVVSFYFLLDGHNIKESIIRTFPKKHYAFLTVLATDMDLALQAFFRGQIILGLLFGAFMIFVYLMLGVHYALVLGVFLGIWEIVPVIGPTIGIVPTVIAVAIDGADNVPIDRLWQVVVVYLVFQLLQWLKDNIVAPKYIGNVIGLHPVMIFVAIMVGARLDGMLGIIYSLPVACVINVFVSHWAARNAASKKVAEVGEGSTLTEAEVATRGIALQAIEEPAGIAKPTPPSLAESS